MNPCASPKEVHVTMHARSISAFVDEHAHTRGGGGAGLICFRCGEKGHVRNQCLTYKIRLCWHDTGDECSDAYCTFAHGKDELRHPWEARCVRVIKQAGTFICIGCNSTEHTFRKCPLHRDLIFL